MNKTVRKILPFILAALLIVSIMPISVWGEAGAPQAAKNSSPGQVNQAAECICEALCDAQHINEDCEICMTDFAECEFKPIKQSTAAKVDLLLVPSENYTDEDLLQDVSAMDENGDAVDVAVKDLDGLALNLAQLDDSVLDYEEPYTITYAAVHPDTAEEFTITRSLFLMAPAPLSGNVTTYQELVDAVAAVGGTPETITNDIAFDYSVQYYYDGSMDNAATDLFTGVKVGTQVATYADKNRNGFELKQVTGITLMVSTNPASNVIRVYYVTASPPGPSLSSYTVQYYYGGILANAATEKHSGVPVGTVISNYTGKDRDGFLFQQDTGVPLAIGSNPASNIIRVYYAPVPDPAAVLSSYSVQYFYDGVLDNRETVNVSDVTVGTLIRQYTAKDRIGLQFQRAMNAPLTIDADPANNIIKVYYVSISLIPPKPQATRPTTFKEVPIPLGFGSGSLCVGECFE